MAKASIKGVAALTRKLRTIARSLPHVAAAALFAEAEIEMAEAKARTPVDTGVLRASGHVDPPSYQGKKITVSLNFGGAARAYAVRVHEDEEAFHPVGQAKYLESVLTESAPYMAKRIARRINIEELL